MSDLEEERRDDRTCLNAAGHGKRSYSKKEAKQVARRQGTGVQVYKCHTGDHWHVGHPSPPRPRVVP